MALIPSRYTNNAAAGTLPYFLQQSGGNVQQARAEIEAKNAGFTSAAAQQSNRQMRNQLEMKANASGMAIKDAYALVPGGDLTNTQSLQEAWNKITVQPPKPPATVVGGETTNTTDTTSTTSTTSNGPSESDIMAGQLRDSIDALSKGFEAQLAAQAAEARRLSEEQNKRFEALNNQFQAQYQMSQRPDVAGVKTATGSAGDTMQIARRGISGVFGRGGLRIRSLNV
jgi:hypothetical protein